MPEYDNKPPSEWRMVNKSYDSSSHGKIFSFLHNQMSRQFNRNVTARVRRYLQQSYSEVELHEGLPSNTELQKDLKGIKDALHHIRGSTFW